MKKEVIYLYPATQDSVRIQKFSKFFYEKKFRQFFIGWKRYRNKDYSDEKFESIYYLVSGGGEGNGKLPALYVLFIIRLFFSLLFKPSLTKDRIVIAINFETAFVVYLVSYIRNIYFIYDIWDEFAISHKFPRIVVSVIKRIDKKIRKRAGLYIHVDENRVSKIDENNKNYVIIYNSPYDFCHSSQETYHENAFAITGWLNNTRGLSSILSFAKRNPHIKFYVIGEFIDSEISNAFLSLRNVEYYHFMPQEDLFRKICHTRGIFSLYDPSITINRLAASNKLYDAMMLSIPVIVNNGIAAASMVNSEHIGYVVNYFYDNTWDYLSIFDEDEIIRMGNKGREIYLSRFEFSNMMENILFPILAKRLM